MCKQVASNIEDAWIPAESAGWLQARSSNFAFSAVGNYEALQSVP